MLQLTFKYFILEQANDGVAMPRARLAKVDSTVKPKLQGDQHRQVKELPHETSMAEGRSRHSGLGSVHVSRVQGRRERLGKFHHGFEHTKRRFLKYRAFKYLASSQGSNCVKPPT